MVSEARTNGEGRILAVTDAAVGVGELRLFESVTFTVRPGELVAIRGPSGCGKSMLLRSVAGLIDFLEGEVRLRDALPETVGWPTYRRQVLLVQQQPVLLRGTVRHSLERPFHYQTANGPFPKDRARDLLDRLLLGNGLLRQDVRTLSVGEQQRVCLVRALLVQPAVLLLDEPTSALDEEAAAAVEEVVRDAATGEQRTAALIVSHDPTQPDRWCDRKIELQSFGASTR